MITSKTILPVLLLLMVVPSMPVRAEDCPLIQTFGNPTPAFGDSFGNSIALAGNVIVAGAWWDDTGGINSGCAYVFDIVTGDLVHTLNNPNPSDGDYFGFSVATDGNKIAVGAYGEDTNYVDGGACYLFDAISGAQIGTGWFSQNTPSHNLGYSVAISGNKLMIGIYDGGAYFRDLLADMVFGGGGGLGPCSLRISNEFLVTGLARDAIAGQPFSSGVVRLYHSDSGEFIREIGNPNPEQDDNFGHSVDISENRLAVGAPQDDATGFNSGCGYLFDATTGALLRVFANPAPDPDDHFGRSIAISGNNVLIGASEDDTSALDGGIVYLFNADDGALLRTFENPTPANGDYFGKSVALDGDKALVAAPWDHSGATHAGSVHLFDVDCITPTPCPSCTPSPSPTPRPTRSPTASPTESPTASPTESPTSSPTPSATPTPSPTVSPMCPPVQTLQHPDPLPDDLFGTSMAVSGNQVLVGAPGDDEGFMENSGGAYLYDAVTGNLVRSFDNPNPLYSDNFGESVALDGNLALIGARWEDIGAVNTGAAYLFDTTTGNLVRQFDNPTPVSNDFFGASVAIQGSNLWIGAPRDGADGFESGSVYQYDTATGNLVRRLQAPDFASYKQFGWTLAISGDQLLIAAWAKLYLFTASSGAFVRSFEKPAIPEADHLGAAATISGDRVLWGDRLYFQTGSHKGGACLFDATTGDLLRVFTNPYPTVYDNFGSSVALSDQKIVIGADRDGSYVAYGGSAFVFDAVSGALLQQLKHPTQLDYSNFGSAAAILGSQVFIGSNGTVQPQRAAGATFIFDVSACPNFTPTPTPTPFDDALILSNTIPAKMSPDQTLIVGVSVRNTGNTAWFADSGHGLAMSSEGCVSVEPVPVLVEAGVTVMPGQAYQFISRITADATPGTCEMDIQMSDAIEGAFGSLMNVSVEIGPPENSAVGWAVYE